MEHKDVVIVGSGASGLACARRLTEAGMTCVVLDRGRRPGGRASSRVLADGRLLDLGVPLFRMSDARTSAFMRRWLENGFVVPFPGRVADVTDGHMTLRDPDKDPRWTGSPSMGALLEAMAVDLPVRQEATVTRAFRAENHWVLLGPEDAEVPLEVHASALVLAMPLPQARRVVSDLPAPTDGNDACLVAAFDDIPEAMPGGSASPATLACYLHGDDLLALVIRRPGRPVVVHASAAWSLPRLERSPADWAAEMAEALAARFGGPVPKTVHAHRWTFARPLGPLGGGCGWDPDRRLAVCGDAWIGPAGRFEGAVLSGLEAADRLLGQD